MFDGSVRWGSLALVLDYVRVAFARYGRVTLLGGLVSALAALAVASQQKDVWRAEAAIALSEPRFLASLTLRETNTAEQPQLGRDAAAMATRLVATEHLVALAKELGLMDRWEEGRVPLARWVGGLRDHLLGPPSDELILETVVELLRRRVRAESDGNVVRLSVEWPSRDVATAIAQGLVSSAASTRRADELRELELKRAQLEERLSVLRTEQALLLRQALAERDRSLATARPPAYGELPSSLRALQAREAELLDRLETQRIAADLVSLGGTAGIRVLRVAGAPDAPLDRRGPLLWLLCLLSGVVAALASPIVAAVASRRLQTPAQTATALSLPVLAALLGPKPSGGVFGRVALGTALALSAASGVATGLGNGNLALGLVPTLAVGGAYLLWHLPLKWPLLALMLAAVTVDDPTDRPYPGSGWRSLTFPLGKVLFANVANFTGFELCLMALGLLALTRRITGSSVDPRHTASPRLVRLALVLSFLTVLALGLLGLARGGDVRHALWQARFLLFLPLQAALALHAFEIPKDLRKLALVVLVGSLVKAALGAYFIFAVARPRGLLPPHTTGHNDSILLVTAVLIPLGLLWERPSRAHLRLALAWLPPVLLALILNERRIAYVHLAFSGIAIFTLSPWHRSKRAVARFALRAALPGALYLAVGWFLPSVSVFAPAAALRAAVAPAPGSELDSSSLERDIENYNLIRSAASRPLFGQGFGHAFTEYVPSFDFAQSNFGHTAHNSVLWLLWIGGALGFVGVFLYVGIVSFYWARTTPRCTDGCERVALYVSLGVLLSYLSQAFGDMGTQSSLINFFVASAVTIVAQLASKHRAWSTGAAERPAATVEPPEHEGGPAPAPAAAG